MILIFFLLTASLIF